MVYVFDTNSFSVLKNYYPAQFRSFWTKFNKLVLNGEIVSVKEVFKELERKADSEHLQEWINSHKGIFLPPSSEESEFVRQIFLVPHFRYLIKPKNTLISTPFADPFVIASAKVNEGCLITEEEKKDNAAKIPNVCEYFGIKCQSLEEFMKAQKWEF